MKLSGLLMRDPRRDPHPDIEWEVWYRDTFDRECPPSVDVSGRGLVKGLMELWARYLFETIRPAGEIGFNRFHIRWEHGHAEIAADKKGAGRLREWVFGDKKHSRKGYVEEGDGRLLKIIATAHASLITVAQGGEHILELAAAAADRKDFETRLAEIQSR